MKITYTKKFSGSPSNSIEVPIDDQILVLFAVSRDSDSGRRTAEFVTFLHGDREKNSQNIEQFESQLEPDQIMVLRNV